MKTCLSSFSDFFKDLACVPHDVVKNVEDTKADLNEVKKSASEPGPENTTVENELDLDHDDGVDDVDSIYEENPNMGRMSTPLEASLILAPIIIGVVYSYVMLYLIVVKPS